MARKARKGPRPTGARQADPERRIIDAALDLAAEHGWARTSLGAIAKAAGIPPADLYARFPSKVAILRAYLAQIDEAALGPPVAADEPVRDRLFDLVMRRFDALAPHKAGVRAILADLPADPATGLCLGPRFLRSMTALADAAGVKTTGLLGALRVKALAATYLCVLRTWFDDESADKASTMAALDRRLKRLEMLENSVPSWKPREASAPH